MATPSGVVSRPAAKPPMPTMVLLRDVSVDAGGLSHRLSDAVLAEA
jgi:hypothetical protein